MVGRAKRRGAGAKGARKLMVVALFGDGIGRRRRRLRKFSEFLPIFTDFCRFSQQKCQKGKNYYMVKYYGTSKGTYVRGIGKGMKKNIPMRNTIMGASNPYF